MARVRPVAMRVQVLPPSLDLRYAEVALVKPVKLSSCAVPACAKTTVFAGSAVLPVANAMRPISVASVCVTRVGRPPAARIDVQVAPPSVLFQKSPLLKCAALLSPAHPTEPAPGEGGVCREHEDRGEDEGRRVPLCAHA